MKISFKKSSFRSAPKVNYLGFVEANDIEHYLTIGSIYHTCACKSITSVSSITGTHETVRYVVTGSKLTASSVVLSAFIHICV